MRGFGLSAMLCATMIVVAATQVRAADAKPQPTSRPSVSSLHDAVKMNDLTSAAILLDRGANANARDPIGNTPLYWALQNGNLEMIRLLRNHGAQNDVTNRFGRAPLEYMRGGGWDNYVRAHPPTTSEIRIALIDAIARENVKAAKAAIEAGAEATDTLKFAASHCDAEMIDLLLAHGAKADQPHDPGYIQSPLRLALRYGKDYHVVELLLAAGADPLAKEDNGRTPLDEAKERGDEFLVQILSADWKRVNEPDRDGYSRLDRAAFAGDRYYARLMIAKGANVNARDRDGRTPLHTAVAWSKRDVAELLVASGADVNAADSYGLTPLFESHDATTAEWLITKGAKIDARDKIGQTALHWAAASGNEKVAEALLKAGADPNAVDKFNRTPAQVAREERKDAVAKLLSK